MKCWRCRRGLIFVLLMVCVVGGLSTGCGPELDTIGVLRDVRIIGVRKSAPYARPGEDVSLQMLWEDGRQSPPRNVQTFFAFWCVNPPGDLFSECLSQVPQAQPHLVFGSSQAQIHIPEDALRPSVVDPRLPPSGTAFVFYGACAGRLRFAGQDIEPVAGMGGASPGAPSGPGGAPRGMAGSSAGGLSSGDLLAGLGDEVPGSALLPQCVDQEGNELGSDDFVIGYSTIFVYEDVRNGHPRIDGFEVAGEPVMVDCIDESCQAPMDLPELDGCQEGVACFDACEDDGALTCPEIEISALIDRSSVEADTLSKLAYGKDTDESMWVSYFVDRGRLSSELRLVNDANTGFNEDYGTSFRAPSEPGPMRIWAAVRDNRGGIAWVRVPAYVRESDE